MSKVIHPITIVGLGPGSIDLLTLEAAEVLQSAERIYLRTAVHPNVDALRDRFPHLEIQSFDDLYESSGSFEEVYGAIVARIVDLAAETEVIYCVPGSPSIGEATVELLRALSSSIDVRIRVVQGVSFIEASLGALGDADTSWLQIMDGIDLDLLAGQNAVGEIQGSPGTLPVRMPVPTSGLLINQVHSRQVATSVKLWLSKYWPEQHEVCLIRGAGTPDETVTQLPILGLDRAEVDHLTTVYVPPLRGTEDVRTFAGLLNVTRTLRAPGGCPWDREQTHDSLKTHLLEETYEVLETLDRREYDRLAEELGDLLFQITIHSQIAAEHDEFDILDVLESITAKLIRRHPHVFSDLDLPSSAAVLERWETFKQAEKPERQSVLSCIPEAMPAMPYSYAVQKRAANQGFEWPDMESLLAKVEEELGELRAVLASDEPRDRILDELGDLLFVIVSVGRRLKADPEEALRAANRKFVRRFKFVEGEGKRLGVPLRDLGPARLDTLWEEAKRTL